MAYTRLISGIGGVAGRSQSFNLTRFTHLGNGPHFLSATESNTARTLHINGKLDSFFISVNTNTITTSPTTAVTRKDSVNANQTISIAAGATGIFEDLVNSDIITSGEKWNYQTITPNTSGSIATNLYSTRFLAFGKHSYWIATQQDGGALGQIDRFMATFANFGAVSITESDVQMEMLTGGILRHLFFNLSANVDFVATWRTRINGNDGNLQISILANQSGIYEDLTNSDTLADGDLYCTKLDFISGTSILCTHLSFLFEPAEGKYFTGTEFATAGGQAVAFNNIRYFPINGIANGALIENTVQFTNRLTNPKLQEILVEVFANTITTDPTTAAFRKNGSSLFDMSIPAGATGIFRNSGTNQMINTDKINFLIQTPNTSGNFTIQQLTVLLLGEPLEFERLSVLISNKTNKLIINKKTLKTGIPSKTHKNTINNKTNKIDINTKNHRVVLAK